MSSDWRAPQGVGCSDAATASSLTGGQSGGSIRLNMTRQKEEQPTPRSPSLLGRSAHLHQAVLVEPEEPPALLLGEVLGAAPLVVLDRGLVVLRHHEHHAGAASLHRQLEEAEPKRQ